MKDFYGKSWLEGKTIDPTKYRGKGRPRKQDYSTIIELQRKTNEMRRRIICQN